MKQIRAVVLGNWDDYLSYFLYGTLEGLIRNGAWVRPVPLFGHTLAEVFAQIAWFKPHLLIAHMVFNRRPHPMDQVLDMLARLRAMGTVVAYHAGDARLRPRYEGDISAFVDFALCNHGLLDLYSSIWKIPCYHWPYPCLHQDSLGDPVPELECDVAFTGALDGGEHHSYRADFINKLQQLVRITVFPTAMSGNTRFQTAEQAASAKAVMGVQMGTGIPLYLDVRPFQYIGAGALYFHDKCAAMDKFFIPGVHYVAYERGNAQDFANKFDYYTKQHPEQGQKIREAAFAYGQKYHSTQARVRFVLELLAGNEPTVPLYLEDIMQ